MTNCLGLSTLGSFTGSSTAAETTTNAGGSGQKKRINRSEEAE